MIRFASILVLATLTILQVRGQKNDMGITGGVMYYMGDLNPSKHFRFPGPGVGFLYRHNFDHHFSVRGNVILGRIWADDAKSKNGYQNTRNLRFSSYMAEVSVQGELNFFQFEPGNRKKANFTPFIFGGVGAFYFNPRSTLSTGEEVSLATLNTEGQGVIPGRKRYGPITACLPFGMGIKWNPWKGATLMLEWGMRYTFTDYLDDVSTRYAHPDVVAIKGENAVEMADQSIGVLLDNTDRQRGFAKNNDWYSYLGLYLTFRIKDKDPTCWTGSKYKSPYTGKRK
ncbi:MAG: DUF6089 family protein [Flavobacteriales bacterium]|nr:DUF6089 family protein [Flavobacteriales bacterium]